MYICICHAVTDRQIRECASAGISSVEELSMELGVGTGCGRCRDCASELLLEACGHAATPS